MTISIGKFSNTVFHSLWFLLLDVFAAPCRICCVTDGRWRSSWRNNKWSCADIVSSRWSMNWTATFRQRLLSADFASARYQYLPTSLVRMWSTYCEPINVCVQFVTCCCCHGEPVSHCLYGGTDVPKRWGIPPDSESWGIRLSLVIVDSHLLTGAPLKGGCRCPQLTYCRPLSNDRCWRMSTNCQAAVGYPTLQWVLRVKRPNQQHHSTEGSVCHLHSAAYNGGIMHQL